MVVFIFAVCPMGTYGENCTGKCGNCAGNQSCDHMTGKCYGGCEAGFQGDKCDTCMFYFLKLASSLIMYNDRFRNILYRLTIWDCMPLYKFLWISLEIHTSKLLVRNNNVYWYKTFLTLLTMTLLSNWPFFQIGKGSVQRRIYDGCGMLTENPYSFGLLVPSHLGLAHMYVLHFKLALFEYPQ